MEQFASLVRWIITYSVSGGFWHFMACWLIVLAITRVFGFVRVKVDGAKTETKSES